ncbi:DsbA family oxidoreductase [Flaviflexus massiliensis]|uniref:DsbA family oxidoreductase n=1 Tax=Flaviflexus massiliensis TaxID=1522309 RepID=UPI0006D52F5C|nr:DsbA family oxidoreductase [Flaviflexus massiliensis]
MRIDLWTDIVCPFCYIGEARLHRALEAEGITANIRYHSFELDPTVTEPVDGAEHMARTKGADIKQITQMEEQLKGMAEGEGLTYEVHRQMGPTVPVHRIAQYANQVSHEMGLTYFRTVQTAYFEGRLDPFDTEAILEVAEHVGLDREGAEDALTNDAMLQAVREDQAIARQLGINGVPYILLEQKLAIPGAVSLEQFQGALRQVKEMA